MTLLLRRKGAPVAEPNSGMDSSFSWRHAWRYAVIALLPLLLMKEVIIDEAVIRMASKEGISSYRDTIAVTTTQSQYQSQSRSLWDKAILEAQELLSKDASKDALQRPSSDVWDTKNTFFPRVWFRT